MNADPWSAASRGCPARATIRIGRCEEMIRRLLPADLTIDETEFLAYQTAASAPA
jgi:hypothetical protein